MKVPLCVYVSWTVCTGTCIPTTTGHPGASGIRVVDTRDFIEAKDPQEHTNIRMRIPSSVQWRVRSFILTSRVHKRERTERQRRTRNAKNSRAMWRSKSQRVPQRRRTPASPRDTGYLANRFAKLKYENPSERGGAKRRRAQTIPRASEHRKHYCPCCETIFCENACPLWGSAFPPSLTWPWRRKDRNGAAVQRRGG